MDSKLAELWNSLGFEYGKIKSLSLLIWVSFAGFISCMKWEGLCKDKGQGSKQVSS